MTGYYTNAGGIVKQVSSMEWAMWFEKNPLSTVVAYNELRIEDREPPREIRKVRVSTVFLGRDSGTGTGAPVLWETMVFGLPQGDLQWRYTSAQEASDSHLKILLKILNGEEISD